MYIKYLGESVWVELEGRAVVLRNESNGSEIKLTDDVLDALVMYVEIARMGELFKSWRPRSLCNEK
jgi:hypothetical protein